jgi:hypothetical protein
MPIFKDYVALMYHEARNVRHLIRGGHFPAAGWEAIISLPKNRESAWSEVELFAASLSNDAATVIDSFKARFGKGLDELIEMFANQNWRHAKQYGGNAWARIGLKVRKLGDALIAGDDDIATLIEKDLQMEEHNTGTVASKLEKLRITYINC